MDYQVPQFIEVEDKIFGPLTIKQFIYLAGAGGLCAIIFLYVPLIFAILLSIPVAALGVALAFYRLNNKPFIEVIEAGFNYYITRHLYLWRKEKEEIPQETTMVSDAQAPVQKLGLSQKKLQDLAWSLDVKNTGEPGAQ